jgi:hypothetical protein
MDDITERDLSRKRDRDLTTEERQELARRFKEFKQLVRERGARNVGLAPQTKAGQGGKKRIKKWDPAAIAAAKKKKRTTSVQ